MLSVRVQEDIDQLLQHMGEAEPLFDGLRKLREKELDCVQCLKRIVGGGQELQSGANELHSYYASAQVVLPSIQVRQFFPALRQVSSALEIYAAKHGAASGHLPALMQQLEEFGEAFDKYLTSHSGAHALPVLRAAPLLLAELESVRANLGSVASQLRYEIQLADDEDTFVIEFSGEHTLRDIIEDLAVLLQILDKIQSLADTVDQRPVRVAKIESGSFWAALVSLRWVVAVAKPLMTQVFGYFYRTRTAEGLLRSVPADEKAAIKHVLDVRKLLKASGIETSRMDAELEDAGYEMAMNVRRLIQRRAKVTVDGHEFSEASERPQRIEYAQPPSLPNELKPALPPPTGKVLEE